MPAHRHLLRLVLGCLALGLTLSTAEAQQRSQVLDPFGDGDALAAAPEALEHDTAGEVRMLRRINALRRAQNLEPLQRDEGLDAAADTHAQDMAAHRELGHVSARTGSPADRVRVAGVSAARIAQNVARQETTRQAMAAILDSEAHRAQLLDPTFTHVGLAAVVADDGVYVAQVLANIPPPPEERLPPPAVAEIEPQGSSVELTSPPPPAVAQAPAAPLAQVPPAPANTNEAPAANQPNQPNQPNPIPTIRVPANHRRVAGYWLHQYGRWWYFPVPRGTPPGTVVRPDPRFTGPPPGMQNQPPRVQQQQPQQTQPGWRSPRRNTNSGTVYWY